MKKKRLRKIQQKKIAKDCWDLDWAFLKWLKPRLKEYLKTANKYVDLEFHKFEIDGKEMTQKEIIERMIYLTERVSDQDDLDHCLYWNDPEEWRKEQKELCLLWAEVLPAMWW